MRHALFIRATTPLLLLAVVLWSAFWFTAQASARNLATTVLTDCTDGGLRAAIANAQPGDTITFRCPSNPTTITLNGSLLINQNLTLDGSGQSVTLSERESASVFIVTGAGQFTLKALTVANGSSNSLARLYPY